MISAPNIIDDIKFGFGNQTLSNVILKFYQTLQNFFADSQSKRPQYPSAILSSFVFAVPPNTITIRAILTQLYKSLAKIE